MTGKDNKVMRLTSQRKVILEELRKVTSHPTATEIYDMVRERLPRISLGTVYRNLELLSSSDIIQKLDFGETQKRFDGNPAPHYHISCSKCGRVDDIHIPMHHELENQAEEISGYEIKGHHVEFHGTCPGCRGANTTRH